MGLRELDKQEDLLRPIKQRMDANRDQVDAIVNSIKETAAHHVQSQSQLTDTDDLTYLNERFGTAAAEAKVNLDSDPNIAVIDQFFTALGYTPPNRT